MTVKVGEKFAVVHGVCWPTPRHMLEAADALDVITVAKYGDILRAVVVGIEAGRVEEPKPWDSAEAGSFWAFGLTSGREILGKRTEAGWVYSGKRHHQLDPAEISEGRLVWSPPLYDPLAVGF